MNSTRLISRIISQYFISKAMVNTLSAKATFCTLMVVSRHFCGVPLRVSGMDVWAHRAGRVSVYFQIFFYNNKVFFVLHGLECHDHLFQSTSHLSLVFYTAANCHRKWGIPITWGLLQRTFVFRLKVRMRQKALWTEIRHHNTESSIIT